MEKAVEVKNLFFKYPDGTSALNGFNAVVDENETLGLAGANGSGKTTFMMILAGFLHPSDGEISLCGEKIDFSDHSLQRKLIGFSFPNPDDQLFMPTVLDDVCFGPLNMGNTMENAEKKAIDILDFFEIRGLASKFPGHLSAGQKRLAALAGVLVMEPKILVLDEPTAFLDPHSKKHLLDKLRQLSLAKIVISHDLEFMLQLCEKSIIISAGRNLAEGKPELVFRNAELMEQSHLEVPRSLS